MLLSRIFFQKRVRANFPNFHAVHQRTVANFQFYEGQMDYNVLWTYVHTYPFSEFWFSCFLCPCWGRFVTLEMRFDLHFFIRSDQQQFKQQIKCISVDLHIIAFFASCILLMISPAVAVKIEAFFLKGCSFYYYLLLLVLQTKGKARDNQDRFNSNEKSATMWIGKHFHNFHNYRAFVVFHT